MGINLIEKGYNDVQAVNPGEFVQLPADGYVCRIVNAEFTNSKAGNLMLVLYIDIAEGDFAGHFKAAVDRVKSSRPDIKWDNSGVYRQLVLDSSGRVARFFKGLLTSISKSNNVNLNLNNFEADSLRGLLCGFIFGAEEYEKKNGDIATRIFAKFPRTADDIREGKFTVPELKKLQNTAPAKPKSNDPFGGTPVDDEDIPF